MGPFTGEYPGDLQTDPSMFSVLPTKVTRKSPNKRYKLKIGHCSKKSPGGLEKHFASWSSLRL